MAAARSCPLYFSWSRVDWHRAGNQRLLTCSLLAAPPSFPAPVCCRVDWHKAGNQRLRCLRITAKEERAVRQKLQVRKQGVCEGGRGGGRRRAGRMGQRGEDGGL